jgi:hypothetical protein
VAEYPAKNVNVWRIHLKSAANGEEIFYLYFIENQYLKGMHKKSAFADLDNSGDFGTIKPYQEKFG